VEESGFCLFSVVFPVRCLSSISPRFYFRKHAFCFLPPVAILESSQNALLKKSNYNIILQLKDFSPILLYLGFLKFNKWLLPGSLNVGDINLQDSQVQDIIQTTDFFYLVSVQLPHRSSSLSSCGLVIYGLYGVEVYSFYT
jgi:hypothetical protein